MTLDRDDSRLPSVAVARSYQLISTQEVGPMVNIPLPNDTYQAVAMVGPYGTSNTQITAAFSTLYNMLQVREQLISQSVNQTTSYSINPSICQVLYQEVNQ